MFEQDRQGVTARLTTVIEEELGTYRHFAHLPATEIEEMAARISKAVAPYVGGVQHEETASRAA